MSEPYRRADRALVALGPRLQRAAVRQVRQGRDARLVAAELGVAEAAIVELWQRDVARRVAEFQKAGSAA